MIVTQIRSSSVGTLNVCENKYMIEYTLGIPHPPNNKASIGSAVHKGLELLALKKLAIQRNENTLDGEELGILSISDVTEEFSINQGFEHYKKKEQPDWGLTEYKTIKKIFYHALEYNGGIFNPANLDIMAVEQHFDFELPYDWAHYHYELPTGEIIDGQLTIRGTMDLVTRAHNGAMEIIDWKTGKRKDINTGKDKEYEDFQKDFQINLYRYAIHKLFPKENIVQFTIVYLTSGGPFTIPMDIEHIEKAESMIKNYFNRIKKTRSPFLIPRKNEWFCQYVCHYNKMKLENTNMDICTAINSQCLQIGADKVFNKYGDSSTLKSYKGGGRSNVK